MLGCLAGSIEIVKKLRDFGSEWSCADRGGSTPLHWAVDGGNVDLVRWMIADGANVSGFTLTYSVDPYLCCPYITYVIWLTEF